MDISQTCTNEYELMEQVCNVEDNLHIILPINCPPEYRIMTYSKDEKSYTIRTSEPDVFDDGTTEKVIADGSVSYIENEVEEIEDENGKQLKRSVWSIWGIEKESGNA